jgi:hypothetical protein
MAANHPTFVELTPEYLAIRHLLQRHLARYPLMRMTDLYKLLFQAACGPEHAVRNEAEALARLDLEVAALESDSDEPVIDPISPDGSLARVHLVPYLGAGGLLSDLARAFVLSAREFAGSRQRLEGYWEIARQEARAAALPFDGRGLVRYWAACARLGFPAVHHSLAYRAHYRPAYRLVLVGYLMRAAGSIDRAQDV